MDDDTGATRLARRHASDEVTATELLSLASLGDATAWDRLMDRYGRLVWLTARSSRLDEASVCDVYQTVWSRLWEHRDRIRNPEGLGSWLVTATRRETWRVSRSLDRWRDLDDESEAIDDPAVGPEGRVLADEQRREVREALERIDPSTRELLEALSREARPDYRRIAVLTGRPIGSIGPTRQRGIEKLRRILATN